MAAEGFVIVDGVPYPDLSHLDHAAVLALRVKNQEGLTKGVPARAAERQALCREMRAIDLRLHELNEIAKHEGMRRNFAGIGSPLYEACIETLSGDVVLRLERLAMEKQSERDRKAAERRSQKAEARGMKPMVPVQS